MDVSESQALFLKFAEPLASYAAIEPSITAMPASLNSVGVIISRRCEKLVRNVAMFEQECAP